MKNMILASTSTLYRQNYLEYLIEELKVLFQNTKQVLFIPYARPSGISYDDYTAIVFKVFDKINIEVKGIHQFENPKEAIQQAKGVFVGGGNTFELVHQLYQHGILELLKNKINLGIPYLGTSAGSNIAGINMKTTNDMPIVYPPSFDTLATVPFNINPHYISPDKNSRHMGETRDTRIKEFHQFNTIPVVGLKEGSWLLVSDTSVYLKGNIAAKLFLTTESILEVAPETDLITLL